MAALRCPGAHGPCAHGDEVLGRLGTLEVRLAGTPAEIALAQALRHRVFSGSAAPGRDVDPFDAVCDHLLVLDRAADHGDAVVGTYRLLRGDVVRGDRAQAQLGFYSAGEFALAPLLAAHPEKRFLELGRSCVLPAYRTKRTVELLWHGAWAYVLRHGIDVMFGCASFEGTDPQRHALPLSFLHHQARATGTWRAAPVPGRGIAMDLLPLSAIDPAAALRALPPLLKGYLRLGARVADGAVIDEAFGTTDVLVVLPVAAISTRYVAHFGEAAERHAA